LAPRVGLGVVAWRKIPAPGGNQILLSNKNIIWISHSCRHIILHSTEDDDRNKVTKHVAVVVMLCIFIQDMHGSNLGRILGSPTSGVQ
jgi:hypothetical protein